MSPSLIIQNYLLTDLLDAVAREVDTLELYLDENLCIIITKDGEIDRFVADIRYKFKDDEDEQ